MIPLHSVLRKDGNRELERRTQDCCWSVLEKSLLGSRDLQGEIAADGIPEASNLWRFSPHFFCALFLSREGPQGESTMSTAGLQRTPKHEVPPPIWSSVGKWGSRCASRCSR